MKRDEDKQKALSLIDQLDNLLEGLKEANDYDGCKDCAKVLGQLAQASHNQADHVSALRSRKIHRKSHRVSDNVRHARDGVEWHLKKAREILG